MSDRRRPYTAKIGMDALVVRADGSSINFGDAIYHPENVAEAQAYARPPAWHPIAHDHGPKEGPGLLCHEYDIEGWLVGECRLAPPDANCVTLEDGSCVGVGCMHDRPAHPPSTTGKRTRDRGLRQTGR